LHAEPDEKGFLCGGGYGRPLFWYCSHLRKVSARRERLLDSLLAVSHRLPRPARRDIRAEKAVQSGSCNSEFQEFARPRFFSRCSLHFLRSCCERHHDLECDCSCEHDSILLSSRLEFHLQKLAFSHAVRRTISIVRWSLHDRGCCRRKCQQRRFFS